MPVDSVDAPVTKEETSSRQAGLNSWMAGLRESMPSPSLGGGADEPSAPPVEPAEEPEVTPTPEPVTPPVTEPAQPAPDKPVTPTPKPNEPTPSSDTPAAEDKWPRSAKEWKNFTQKRKEKEAQYEKQLQEREAKIKELEAKTQQTLTPEIQKQIDTLTKENGEYSERLRILDIVNHPKFKSYFENKVNGALSQLKNIVKAEQVDEVAKLLQSDESEAKNDRINELLLNMSPLQQGRFIGVINSLASTQNEMQTEIGRAKENYDQMVAQAKTQREQQQGQVTKLLDDTIKNIQDPKNGRPEYQLRDGETEWNASVGKRIDAAKKLIQGNLSADVMFKAAFDAAAHADVLVAYKALLGEHDKLKAQIASMTASNPKVKQTVTNGTGTEPSMPKDARPMDYSAQWVKKFGQAMRGEQ